jgi:HD-GYP domain-containing protein (c-di-GMP phosphodiesterase class II)
MGPNLINYRGLVAAARSCPSARRTVMLEMSRKLYKGLADPPIANDLVGVKDDLAARHIIIGRVSAFIRFANAMSDRPLFVVECMLEACRHYDEVNRVIYKNQPIKKHPVYGHLQRVGFLSGLVAQRLNLGPRSERLTQLSGLVHDLGKVGVDPRILFKNGNWNAEEKRMKPLHLRIGAEILDSLGGDFREIVNIVGLHHYRDGYIYRGDKICMVERSAKIPVPVESQIVGVVDRFDAYSSPRPSRDGKAHAADESLEWVEEGTPNDRGPNFFRQIFSALNRVVRPQRSPL